MDRTCRRVSTTVGSPLNTKQGNGLLNGRIKPSGRQNVKARVAPGPPLKMISKMRNEGIK